MLRAWNVGDCAQSCSGDETTASTSTDCENLNLADIFVWAPGSADVALPTDVGFRFGNASGGFLSVSLQTHYNNPDGDESVVDNSGVSIYYTEELRPIDMGVIQLGDPVVALRGTSVSEGRSSYSFQCPSSCFEQHFQVRQVIVHCVGGETCRCFPPLYRFRQPQTPGTWV